MKTACALLTLILSISTFPAAEKTVTDPAASGMERRFFDVMPSFLMRSQEIPNVSPDTADGKAPDGLKRAFSALGVKWPEGSSVTHVPQLGKLVVVNTRENMAAMEKALALLNVLPCQVKLEFFFVAFPTAMVAKAESGKHFAADDALKLWKDGKGRAVSTLLLITTNAAEASTKNTTAFIYPTEFSFESCGQESNSPPSVVGGAVMPGGFETRDVGAMVNAWPQVRPDGQILDIALSPQFVEDPTWEDYKAVVVPTGSSSTNVICRQPIFSAHLLSTQLSVRPGSTVVVSGGWNLRRTPEVMYLIMKTDLVDLDGKVLPSPDLNVTLRQF